MSLCATRNALQDKIASCIKVNFRRSRLLNSIIFHYPRAFLDEISLRNERSFRENTKMGEVMRAYFAKELLVDVGQLTPCAKLQVCSRTVGGFMRHWMPDVHLMWSEGVAHLLNESCRLGSILKPVCGPRVHGTEVVTMATRASRRCRRQRKSQTL